MTVPSITSIDLEQVSKSSTLLANYDMIFVLFIELSIACNTLRRAGWMWKSLTANTASQVSNVGHNDGLKIIGTRQ
jgi:hypothetical protein